jgi:hypothetical protein
MRSLDGSDYLRFLTRTCEPCFNVLVSSRDQTLTDYLESLGFPAAVIAGDHTVLSANRPFKELKKGADVHGMTVGQVLGCMYSPLLGQCGETVACLLCHLRQSIEKTMRTGEGLRNVPVSYPHQEDVRRTWSITTQRTGDTVLVVLEPRGAAVT